MFDQGLFENPYVEEENARETVANEEKIEEAYEAHQKSVVLLKNQENTLPLAKEETIKIYVKEYGTTKRLIADALAAREYKIEITEDYNEADYLITYLSGKSTEDIVHDLELKNAIGEEYEEWKKIGNTIKENGGKRITIINMQTAYILDGIEQHSDSILAGFNTYTCAIMDVIVGNYEPIGVLPFTLPAGNEVLQINEEGKCASPNDVPGYDKTKYMENGLKYEYVDTNGNTYICGYGLEY